MADETYSEYIIWGIPPGETSEIPLRTVENDGKPIVRQDRAEWFKKWCEERGAKNCRIQHISSDNPPDFAKVFN